MYSYDLENGQSINDYSIVEGRLPETSGEIALDSNEGFLSDVQIGDKITLESGEDTGNQKIISSTKLLKWWDLLEVLYLLS